MDLYYTENQYLGGGHPITQGASNFHLDDEIYYDMDVKPEARVLAAELHAECEGRQKAGRGRRRCTSTTSSRRCGPTKRTSYRAFVSIPGHLVRDLRAAAISRRSCCAASRGRASARTSMNTCKPEEISTRSRIPTGGPQKPADTLANLEVHPDFTMKLVAAEPLITQADEFRLGPRGPALGRGDAGVSEWPARDAARLPRQGVEGPRRHRPDARRAGAQGAGQDQHPHRHRRRRRDGQEGGLLRGPRSRHRLRLPPGRRHRHAGAGHSFPPRHRRRRQGATRSRSSTPASAPATRTR